MLQSANSNAFDRILSQSLDFVEKHKLAVFVQLLFFTFLTFWTVTSKPRPPPISHRIKEKMSQIAVSDAKSTEPVAPLNPPKDDVFTLQQLSQYNGSDPTKPIYVAIKGIVFDVSAKADVYGPSGSYHIFAGKDGSKGLGLSSLSAEDSVPDYSSLGPAELKVLDDWVVFFKKRYNIVGHVGKLPSNL